MIQRMTLIQDENGRFIEVPVGQATQAQAEAAAKALVEPEAEAEMERLMAALSALSKKGA